MTGPALIRKVPTKDPDLVFPNCRREIFGDFFPCVRLHLTCLMHVLCRPRWHMIPAAAYPTNLI